MLKVLSIGNSYSQDAHRYLHEVSKNEGNEIKCVNLYIGGCSLYTHYINMLEDKKAYSLELNGTSSGFFVSIKEALISDRWDYVTLQQVSSASFDFDEYDPYLEKLAEYVRLYSPKTKILMHKTWADREDSPRYAKFNFESPERMLSAVSSAYKLAAEKICAAGIIPSGDAMMAAYKLGVTELQRDHGHASLGIGRYLLALVWYKALTGKCAEKDISSFDADVSREDVEKIRTVI